MQTIASPAADPATTPAGTTKSEWPAGMIAVVPVYNHAATVGTVVRELIASGAQVLVVDDGSTDGSGDVAREAGGEVITQTPNKGKGVALRSAFFRAAELGYRQALTIDADGQHPLSEALRLRDAATDPTTIYVGERTMPHAPFSSRFGRWWSNLWSWIACNAWVGDSQSGLRVYPLPFVSQLPNSANRYSYEVEVLIRGVWAGLLVKPIAVDVAYPPDRISHFNKLKDNLRTASTFTRLVLRRLWPKRHQAVVERVKPTLKQRLHAILTSGLEPRPAAIACAVGSGIGVAPIPGLQFAAAVFSAWFFRLNMPLVLLTANLSFGPLLFVWGAICSAIGVWMRTGNPIWESYQAIFAEFESKGTSFSGINELMLTFLGDWLLGSLIVIPVVSSIFALLGFVTFWAIKRRC